MGQRVLVMAIGSAAMGLCAQAFGGGFAIGTQSGSGTGNAFAGGAASAEDPSTVWYNPAGMTLLTGKSNVAVSAHALKPSFKFQNSVSTLPIGTGEGGDGGDWAVVPQLYATTALGEHWRAGFAFNVPFGLATEYDAGWRGQPVSLLSDLKTFNFNVGVAYKASDSVSFGGGVSYQKAKLKFNSVAPTGLAEVKLDDDAFGFNLGVLFQPSRATRIGVHYRSSIHYQLSGTLTGAALGGNSTAEGGVRTPESVSFSVLAALSPRWEIMGDVTWTAWSRLKSLDVVRTSGALVGVGSRLLTFNWKDTWRYSVGANYKVNDGMKLRFGIAFDETPTNDVDRTPRIPDQDRTWVAIGVQYRFSKAGVLEVGYAHEFIKDARVDNAAGAARLTGQFENSADILSFQYSHSF